MRLWVLDVGQGNAALLRTPHGHTAVIDGGPGGTALNEGVGRHLPFWQNNLDLVLLSAPKSENVSGLVDLLGRRKVSQIVQTPFETTTGLLGAWREAIEQSGAPAYYAQRGDVIRFDGEPEVALRVLYPARERQGPIVLKVEYGGISILLAASLEKEDETRLLDIAEEGELTSEVLVVPDHGSDTALSPRLLAAVDPTVAVISVGVGNRGEDPAPEVLQRLQEAGARVYRTDTNGTIEVTVDDGKLWVGSER
jgi:competence protein ComEC